MLVKTLWSWYGLLTKIYVKNSVMNDVEHLKQYQKASEWRIFTKLIEFIETLDPPSPIQIFIFILYNMVEYKHYEFIGYSYVRLLEIRYFSSNVTILPMFRSFGNFGKFPSKFHHRTSGNQSNQCLVRAVQWDSRK